MRGEPDVINGFTRKFKPLDVMTSEEVEAVHRGALYVLAKTGMRIEHEQTLQLCADHGCQVELGNRRVRMPPGLVEESIRRCPSSYVLKARDSDKDLMVGGNTVHFMQGMGMRYVDLETWETRPATASEHREAMIVADALEHTHLADGVFFYMEREGIPPVMVMLENLASGLRYSSKAEQFGYQQDCSIFAVQMAQALGINLDAELDTASPLTIFNHTLRAAWRYVEAGIPIQPTVSIATGSEGPATRAGSLVLAVAMVMAWAVITQLIKPGAPMSVQQGNGPMNMATGSVLFGTADGALSTAMMNQMLRRYGLPSCSSAGFSSNSKTIDFQVGYEKGLGALVDALSGGNLLIFQGGSCGELLYHPVLAILDDDVAGWIGRFLQGVTVADETLAIDLINQVGPIPGHYLSTAHTREWWRKEQWLPKAADLEAYPVWVRSGKRDALTLAQERMAEILASHVPESLTPEQEQSVEEILTDARQFYRDRGSISGEEWSAYVTTLQAG
jgi:trimethylamine--corrinoid protein Co-methyltransferase